MKQKFIAILMLLGISMSAQAQFGGLGARLGMGGGGGPILPRSRNSLRMLCLLIKPLHIPRCRSKRPWAISKTWLQSKSPSKR